MKLIAMLLACCFCLGNLGSDASGPGVLIRVGIREGRPSVAMVSTGGMNIYTGTSFLKSVDNNVVVRISNRGKDMYVDGDKVIAPVTFHARAYQGTIRLTDGYTYRGSMECLKTPGRDGLTVVNVVPVEYYLYGVVGKEMSPSWNLEALKAQAVAARTYAITHKNYYRQRGFDVTDDTRSQMYGGMNGEAHSVIRAVDETNGEVLFYKGKLIDAIFCSTAGGWTENSENVWGRAYGYLRGVPDFSRTMPEYRWHVKVTPEQMANVLQASGRTVGEVTGILLSPLQKRPMSVGDRGISGRVRSLTIYGTDGKVTLSGNAFQSLFSLKSAVFDVYDGQSSLPDPETNSVQREEFFTVDKGIPFVIYGFGWGHGLGMSQYGAYHMALSHRGVKNYYRTILAHYYTGTSLEQLY
ncbi:stage II sporulation protein SpoIID [Megasphaera hutchinsoni]|uniref:Stage II sporulation protein SpoIID n=1 Tax=Megasphaera hutchinsoni TaxID=1588748 RepID=A0A2J8BBE1_9FIRM|nr:SpoIID/LytB domain-containing protein [Megasphaera genomosp. type_2]MUP59620.1 SpoIID/LytB domain-containing protein [Veillonellaceae bacterium M2-4]PNH22092.1 stage II sporulation protein SpoIID [Megasphaera genomosp. type_2]